MLRASDSEQPFGRLYRKVQGILMRAGQYARGTVLRSSCVSGGSLLLCGPVVGKSPASSSETEVCCTQCVVLEEGRLTISEYLIMRYIRADLRRCFEMLALQSYGWNCDVTVSKKKLPPRAARLHLRQMKMS